MAGSVVEDGSAWTSSCPRRRWDLLSKAVKELKGEGSTAGKRLEELQVLDDVTTTRRFHGFGLFSHEDVIIDGNSWIRITSGKKFRPHEDTVEVNPANTAPATQLENPDTTFSKSFELFLRKEISVSLADLTGFDNTGNICIWPAEEVMAFWCLRNPSVFRGKKVCELGGGMTSLAGNAVAAMAQAEMVLLTDGNEKCVSNCEAIVAQNHRAYSSQEVSARRLRWDVVSDYKLVLHTFEVIIAADCVFKTEYHEDLCRCIRSILKTDGVAIIFAPRRGTTLFDFLSKAKETFDVFLADRYDETLFGLHQNQQATNPDYNEDLNYPLKVELRIKSEDTWTN